MNNLGSGAQLEKLTGQMAEAADTAGSKTQFVRFLAGERNHFLH